MEADEAEGGHVRAADAVRDLLEGEPARLAEEPRLQHAPAIAAASRPGFVPVRLRGGIGPENLPAIRARTEARLRRNPAPAKTAQKESS